MAISVRDIILIPCPYHPDALHSPEMIPTAFRWKPFEGVRGLFLFVPFSHIPERLTMLSLLHLRWTRLFTRLKDK